MDNTGSITVTLKELGKEPKMMTLPEGATPKDLFDRMQSAENIQASTVHHAGSVITPSSPGQLQNGQTLYLAPNLKNG